MFNSATLESTPAHIMYRLVSLPAVIAWLVAASRRQTQADPPSQRAICSHAVAVALLHEEMRLQPALAILTLGRGDLQIGSASGCHLSPSSWCASTQPCICLVHIPLYCRGQQPILLLALHAHVCARHLHTVYTANSHLAFSAHEELCYVQDSIDEYPYSTYMYLIERLNEIENLCASLRPP